MAVLNDRSRLDGPEERVEFESIELREDDLPLVVPGSVFYWMIGTERTPAGQVRKILNIEFSRLPVWDSWFRQGCLGERIARAAMVPRQWKPHLLRLTNSRFPSSVPAKGNCILIHLGGNEWCVIDSCISRGKTEPVAVEYLRGFNNDALANVKLVVATHWHDDHIGGMASLLSHAPHAEFCCSMALRDEEFTTLISSARQMITGRSGVDEFGAILDELEARGRRAPKFAVENKPLLTLLGLIISSLHWRIV